MPLHLRISLSNWCDEVQKCTMMHLNAWDKWISTLWCTYVHFTIYPNPKINLSSITCILIIFCSLHSHWSLPIPSSCAPLCQLSKPLEDVHNYTLELTEVLHYLLHIVYPWGTEYSSHLFLFKTHIDDGGRWSQVFPVWLSKIKLGIMVSCPFLSFFSFR